MAEENLNYDAIIGGIFPKKLNTLDTILSTASTNCENIYKKISELKIQAIDAGANPKTLSVISELEAEINNLTKRIMEATIVSVYSISYIEEKYPNLTLFQKKGQ